MTTPSRAEWNHQMNATRRNHSLLFLSIVLSVSLLSSLSHAKRPSSGLASLHNEAAQTVRRALQLHGLSGSATVSTSVRNVRVARSGRRLEVSCEVRVRVAAWGPEQSLRDGAIATATGRGTVTSFNSSVAKARRQCVASVAKVVANKDVIPFVAARAK